jgi:hypothetical protein
VYGEIRGKEVSKKQMNECVLCDGHFRYSQSLFDLKKEFSLISTARGDFVSVDELTRLCGIEEPAS